MGQSKLEVLVDGKIIFEGNYEGGLEPIDTQHDVIKMANHIAMGGLVSGRAVPIIHALGSIAQAERDVLDNMRGEG